MEFKDFIKPELLLLIPILMGIASQLKAMPKVPDYVIPVVVDILGILFAGLYIAATATDANLAMSLFTGMTQGLLCSLAAIGLHQTIKQTVEKG
jgi:hypothetical protein